MGDVNGDRRADVCARTSAGVECWLADGEGFPTRVAGPAWSDANGWGAMHYWSTMRLADVNGDGRADVCARSSTDLRCVLASESGFGSTVIVAELSNSAGWSDRANYATLRVGDVNGDGADDLCARSNTQVYCWTWDGDGFVRHDGPGWSDDGGWSAAQYYDTIQLADIDGDGMDDLCARASAGWTCHRSQGDSFAASIALGDMGNSQGWTEPRYWTTIMSGSRSCRTEMEACNGRDDDCDGAIDEHGADEICNGVDDDCDALVDENATGEVCNGRDDDCDGAADEGLGCGPIEGDGGVGARRDGSTDPGRSTTRGGCTVTPGASAAGAWWALMIVALVIRKRRRV